jgi:hypothetical protein
MNPNTLLLSAGLFAALAVQPTRLERVVFQPAAGTSLSKKFEVSQEFTMEDSVIKVNGVEQRQPDDVEMSMSMRTSVALTDEYLTVEGGQVVKYQRTFDDLAGAGNMTMDMGAMGNDTRDVTLISDLEGHAVVFEWNAETRAFTPRFAKEGAKKELLATLVEDFDLRGFLPGREVAQGDAWDVDMVALRNVLAPGNGLAMHPEDPRASGATENAPQNLDFGSLFRESAARTLRAQFEGLREANGRRLGVIALSGKVRAIHDATEDSRRGVAKRGDSKDPAPDLKKVTVDVEIELRGELLWDLDGGHAHSLRVNGTERLHQQLDLNQDMGGNSMRVEDSSTQSGPFDVAIDFRRNG